MFGKTLHGKYYNCRYTRVEKVQKQHRFLPILRVIHRLEHYQRYDCFILH